MMKKCWLKKKNILLVMMLNFMKNLFSMEGNADAMGISARKHALKTHDPETNLRDLLNIYHEIGK